MLAPQASCVKELEEWETAWQNSKIGFHKPGVHKLADMGHSVEISGKALKEFFEENKVAYSEEPVSGIPGAKVYKRGRETRVEAPPSVRSCETSVAVTLNVNNPAVLLNKQVCLESCATPSNVSSMLAPQAEREMGLGEWNQRWQDGRTGFHQQEVHEMLENSIDRVLAQRTGVRFFFPLCGKAVDMKWLADMGHSVVGVEISEKAIKEFFEDNNMTYVEEPVAAIPGAKVFKSSDGNVSLYQCDLFTFSSSIAGQFGAIWDRGSLVAINPRDREKYAALIASLMAKDCRYLLDTLLYNPELYPGPPFFVPDEQVHSLFGSTCDVELLQSVDAMTERWKSYGLDFFTENVYLLTVKSS